MGKKKWVAIILYTIFIIQFVVGAYMFVRSAINPGQSPHPITHICPNSGTKGTFLQQRYLGFLRVCITYVLPCLTKPS